MYHFCFISLAILFFLLEKGVRGQMGEPFKLGMVADEFGTYSVQDTEIKEGVLFWAKWVNDKGGL